MGYADFELLRVTTDGGVAGIGIGNLPIDLVGLTLFPELRQVTRELATTAASS